PVRKSPPPPMPGNPDKSLASMGIYVFNAQFLYDQLERDFNEPGSSRDFGKDIIPYLVTSGARVMAHDFAESAILNGHESEPY
ncbi:sugar phosphate nucleotidyltransferase, partial [Pantoea sp. SIMBA_072]